MRTMKFLATVLATLFLAGCATGPVVDTTYSSIGHSSRVRFVVLHYTVGDFPNALEILMGDRVSSHYLVRDNPPTVYRLPPPP